MKKCKFPLSFWIANTMELFERWAWYGLFMVLAIYFTGNKETGALGFSQQEKGYLMGTVVALLYFLPILTGTIADRIGYKRSLFIAYIILISGYLMLGTFTNFYAVFFAFLYLASGAALFKPVISATIAKTTNSSNSSLGFGIFYMIVNIGALLGPIAASKLRESSWSFVFYSSASAITLNLILLIFYKEPLQIKKDKKTFKELITQEFNKILLALSDKKLIFLLLIIVGFWTMYNQLFYTLPVFVDQWVDTSILFDKLYSISPFLASKIGTSNGVILPEMLLNIDALYIVCFQLLISTIVAKFLPLKTMMSGFIISSIGIGLTFITQNPIFLLFAIFIFGIGEMIASPKITEYIGKIAPPDKIALYMGCSYLPFSLGSFFAGIISGNVYVKMSDKFSLLRIDLISKNINLPQINENYSTNDFFLEAASKLNMSEKVLTNYLWETYHPFNVWILITSIGLLASLMLYLYNKKIIRYND